MNPEPPLCLLCLRPIPPGVPQCLHHLIPKLRGGKGGPTVLLRQICHSENHASLTGTEPARSCYSIEALRAHSRLARFIGWAARRPPESRSRLPKTGRRRIATGPT